MAILTYASYTLVTDGRFEITPSRLELLCAVLNGTVLYGLVTSAWMFGEDRLARFSLCQGGQILLGVVFAPSRTTRIYAILYAVASVGTAAAGGGPQALTSMFFLQQAFQSAMGIALPCFVEAPARKRLMCY